MSVFFTTFPPVEPGCLACRINTMLLNLSPIKQRYRAQAEAFPCTKHPRPTPHIAGPFKFDAQPGSPRTPLRTVVSRLLPTPRQAAAESDLPAIPDWLRRKA